MLYITNVSLLRQFNKFYHKLLCLNLTQHKFEIKVISPKQKGEIAKRNAKLTKKYKKNLLQICQLIAKISHKTAQHFNHKQYKIWHRCYRRNYYCIQPLAARP